MPPPLLPPVIVSQPALLLAVQGQPPLAVTVTLPAAPLPPRESTVQHLIDCIVHDRVPQSGVHNGLAVAEIVTAAYQSAQSGDFVALPLADEKHPLIGAEDQVIDGLLD